MVTTEQVDFNYTGEYYQYHEAIHKHIAEITKSLDAHIIISGITIIFLLLWSNMEFSWAVVELKYMINKQDEKIQEIIKKSENKE